MSTTEELASGQRAEPRQCGSCRYFRRTEYSDGCGGTCEFRFPEKIARAARHVDHQINDEGYPINQRDTDGCDLWKAKEFGGRPVQFVQRRYWYAGEPS